MPKEALGNVILKTASEAMVARQLCKQSRLLLHYSAGTFFCAQLHTVVLPTSMAVVTDGHLLHCHAQDISAYEAMCGCSALGCKAIVDPECAGLFVFPLCR